MTFDDLPAINASLNGLATVLIIAALIAIKREAKSAHGMLMGAAFVTSSVFLICYVAHKIHMGGMHTKFQGQGAWVPIYYTMLITHIILAICVPPLAIVTMLRARRGDYVAHKRLAKVTYPIWLYVGVTGVLVYFFLYRWFLPA
jgi:putative membrane protein